VAVGFDAGRGRSYVSAVEMGYKNPTFVTLIGIVRTLGVPLAELVEVYQRHLDEIDPQAGADVPACPTPEALDFMRQLSVRALAHHHARAARNAQGRMRTWT